MTPEQLDKVLPIPQGYQLLLAVPKADDSFGGTIIKADSTRASEEMMTLVGMVLAVGEQAYKDPVRYPLGKPWCKVGDYILMRAYTGQRFKIGDNEFRLINDDAVLATVNDFKAISRVL
jgi:co-chaperonin GroES (HSP10)